MKLADQIGIGLIYGFIFGNGLWWLTFPKGVIKFYTRLTSGRSQRPPLFGVRLLGVLWLIFGLIILAISK